MIALLSLLTGGLTSLVPAIIQAFSRWLDYRQSTELAQINADLQLKALETGQQIATINAVTAEEQALMAQDIAIQDPFWNKVRASIRPVVTYLFVTLFVLAKFSLLYFFLTVKGVSYDVAMGQVWDEPTSSIFAAIVGFWFGGRMLEKAGFFTTVTPPMVVKKRQTA